MAHAVDERPPEPIDPAHRQVVEAGLADWRAGRLATDAEIGGLRAVRSLARLKLTYAAQARADLSDKADYREARSPSGAERVAISLRRTIERLRIYPLAGRARTAGHLRKVVEPKYGYLIYCAVVPDEEIVILSICHPARQRTLEDE